MLTPLISPFPEPQKHTVKDIDVFFSGASFSAAHSEKPRFLYHLAELAQEYSVVVVDGHLNKDDYKSLLSRSKFSPVVNRYCGCPSPRWHEMLNNSGCVLYPEGTFYSQFPAGAFPYHENSIASDIRRHLESYGKPSSPASDPERIYESASEQFEIYRESRSIGYERFLKYAVFTTLVWKTQTESKPIPARQRAVWLTPHIDITLFGSRNIEKKITRYADTAASRLDMSSDDKDYCNAAKLYVQLCYFYPHNSVASFWCNRAKEILEEGLRRFPRSLLLRFNQASWQVFEPGISSDDKVTLFERVIADFDELEFDPLGSDVGLGFVMEGTDRVFSYIEYGREMMSLAASKGKQRENISDPRKQILAACHGYIGWEMFKNALYQTAVERLKVALLLHPNNYHMLRLAFDAKMECLINMRVVSIDDASDLVYFYFAMAELSPAVLLKEAHNIVPVLHRAGREAEIRKIFREWYLLSPMIYYTDNDQSFSAQLEIVHRLIKYEEYFPEKLKYKIKILENRDFLWEDMSHFEELLYNALPSRPMKRESLTYRSFNFFLKLYKARIKPIIPHSLHYRLSVHWNAFRRTKLVYRYLNPRPLRMRKYKPEGRVHIKGGDHAI
jgi:hypothetical protein